MKERIDFFSKVVICAIGAVLFGYIILKHIFLLALPFLIAWGVAFAVRRPAHFISEKTRAPERFLRLLMSMLLIALTLSLLFFAAWKLITEGWRLLTTLGEGGKIAELAERVIDPSGALAGILPSGIAELLSGTLEAVVASVSEAFAGFAARFVGAVPRFFLFLIVSLIAVIYFSLDLERVNGFVKSKLPDKFTAALVRFKNGIFGVGLKYARAYIIIMMITFAICFAGLLLLGVRYALLIAVIISVLDILPIIGIGTVFIPWAVFELAIGSRSLGAGLIVLFLIAEFVRQLAEPKIIGKNLGLHPIVSLILLYGSYSLFGIVGILLIPCAVVILNALINKNDAPEVAKGSVRETDEA